MDNSEELTDSIIASGFSKDIKTKSLQVLRNIEDEESELTWIRNCRELRIVFEMVLEEFHVRFDPKFKIEKSKKSKLDFLIEHLNTLVKNENYLKTHLTITHHLAKSIQKIMNESSHSKPKFIPGFSLSVECISIYVIILDNLDAVIENNMKTKPI